MEHKKKISLMLIVILLLQIILPTLTVIFETDFTLISEASDDIGVISHRVVDETYRHVLLEINLSTTEKITSTVLFNMLKDYIERFSLQGCFLFIRIIQNNSTDQVLEIGFRHIVC